MKSRTAEAGRKYFCKNEGCKGQHFDRLSACFTLRDNGGGRIRGKRYGGMS